MSTDKKTTSSSAAKIHLVWGCVFIAFATLGLLSYKITLDKAEAVGDRAIKESKQALSAMTAKAEKYAAETAAWAERSAEKFKTGQITETFRAEIPVFESAGIGRLDVGTSTVTETLKKSDVRKVAWDWIYLGETETEISVPVTYRYHLDLAGEWNIEVTERDCLVVAPKLQPSLPVAIHTNEMKKKSSNGWARWDADEQIEELQKSITPTLNDYAGDPKHLKLIREEARLTIARFIQAWLLREDQWQEGKIRTVRVVFPDETIQSRPTNPTVTLQDPL